MVLECAVLPTLSVVPHAPAYCVEPPSMSLPLAAGIWRNWVSGAGAKRSLTAYDH